MADDRPGELYIGLMTGTSVDAIDAALVDFSSPLPALLATHSSPLPEPLVKRVHALIGDPNCPAIDAWRADALLADACVSAVDGLLRDARLDDGSPVERAMVRAIGSHGQTLWHEPDGEPAFTVQIGDPSRIAVGTGITTVADFRRADVAAGGQGAPLAPALHAAMFASADAPRAVLNLGGIANLTYLPRIGNDTERDVIGFDTGPANTLLDAWARRCLGAPMDRDGALARRGSVDGGLLTALLADSYFARPGPKSTGREHFNLDWLQAHAGARLAALADADVMRTLVEVTSTSVTDAVSRYAADATHVYVCGGGAHNPVLMDCLQRALAPKAVTSIARLGIAPDWVEAVAFAWLAWRRLQSLPGNLPSVTGAAGPVVMGGVFSA